MCCVCRWTVIGSRKCIVRLLCRSVLHQDCTVCRMGITHSFVVGLFRARRRAGASRMADGDYVCVVAWWHLIGQGDDMSTLAEHDTGRCTSTHLHIYTSTPVYTHTYIHTYSTHICTHISIHISIHNHSPHASFPFSSTHWHMYYIASCLQCMAPRSQGPPGNACPYMCHDDRPTFLSYALLHASSLLASCQQF